jgi:dinuclear metal center protein, YbgI/SA1388 family
MRKEKFIESIEAFCDPGTAEDWDNCGFQVNTEFPEVGRVLVALEVTSEVIDETIEVQADMIVTHHPMIFGGINKVDDNDIIGNYIQRLVKAGISVYSCHTSFDKMSGGNNDYLGQVLELVNIEPFENGNEFCRKAVTPFEVTFAEFIHKAAELLEVSEKCFNVVGDLTRTVYQVGWCTGAGAEFLQEAVDEGCDLYITGDLKYHDAQKAKELDICVLDAGHYGTEKIFVDNMAEFLRGKTTCEIIESKIDINPFIC